MRRLYILLFILYLPLSSIAKDRFQGIILDGSGKPLKGIRVNIVGLFKYTKTNANGIFKFKNIIEGDTLMVYPSEKRIVKIPVITNLSPIITLDNEYSICAVGKDTLICPYQEAQVMHFDSNIITQRQIKERAPKDLIELLRGNVAGLRIYDDGGTPKASLRASSSFELSTEPLFIIDHSEYESLEAVNGAVSVEDIKEVIIKKDGAGYGMKGANGVIIIVTK